ncbi:tyrosine recombinase [Hyphomonas pacifica]|uniref:Tyrosine recombinase XerC n=1 Tax=Hyphomonas pacifica TaxID=1280941 RepID=A0A062U3W0_9PROT|nr:tyrosine recombinase [Hyphomonas pacifica]KCZ50830.1 tyrosine recombinase XerD [Hyphomonas pacifica]RAN33342.1 tyrosine recombinase XerD [Hyphomonas pacifica]RAN37001.1 tyrosine recombinase XerD [Hyphomonas pacifica]
MSDRRRIEAFLEMMSAERGASANTLDAYGRDLLDASEFCGGKLCDAEDRELSVWLADLAGRGLAPSTQARKLSAIRRFYRFLFEEGDRRDDPTAKLDGPKPGRDVPDVLSREEMTLLLETCEEDLRLRCLVELLYGAGLRASELVSLKLGSLPRRKGARWVTTDIIIRGKGGKERLCPLGKPALQALSDWLAVREDHLPEGSLARGRAEPFLFPSRGKAGHLTRRRLGQLLEELAMKAGIRTDRVHPHALRHAYATHLLMGGADLRSVQTLLGHSDIATTQIYTHVLTDELAELLETAHPMARKS